MVPDNRVEAVFFAFIKKACDIIPALIKARIKSIYEKKFFIIAIKILSICGPFFLFSRLLSYC